MKRYALTIAAMAALTACSWENETYSGTGYLSLGSICIDDDMATKAASAAPDDFIIEIFDYSMNQVKHTTLADVRSDGGLISLAAGSYTIFASSSDGEVPAAAFESPVYGASTQFDIAVDNTTELATLTCTLLQTAVTVDYSDDFVSMVTGDGAATVSVSPDAPLSYVLDFNGGSPRWDGRKGYFAVNNGLGTTMEISYKGLVDGKLQKMTKVFTGIMPRTWHKVTFVKKMDSEGNANADVVITGFLEDEELSADMIVVEDIIGEDPDAPAGDGGICLESTCGYDLEAPIIVAPQGSPFNLTMLASVPNMVKSFTVDVSSTNEAFVNSLRTVNDGSSVLDLVNPSAGAISVFTTIIPFPYGDAVSGRSEIAFDLSAAQVPILAFKGTHTFTMKVVDRKGCRKNIELQLVVE